MRVEHEMNRIEKIVFGDFEFDPADDPAAAKVLFPATTSTLENCGETVATTVLNYSEEAKSVERVSIPSFDIDYPLVFDADSTKFFTSAKDPVTGKRMEFVVGRSFFGTDLSFDESEILRGNYTVSADPWQVVTVTAAYHEFLYDYHWTATATIHFTDGRLVPLSAVRGRVYGSRVMSSFVDSEATDCPPTAPSAAPSMMLDPFYIRPVYLRIEVRRPMRGCKNDYGSDGCEFCGPQYDAYPRCRSGYVPSSDDCSMCIRTI